MFFSLLDSFLVLFQRSLVFGELLCDDLLYFLFGDGTSVVNGRLVNGDFSAYLQDTDIQGVEFIFLASDFHHVLCFQILLQRTGHLGVIQQKRRIFLR